MSEETQSRSLGKYLREAFEELNKVTWPTRKQSFELFVITVIITLLVTAFIAGLDYLFAEAYRLIVT